MRHYTVDNERSERRFDRKLWTDWARIDARTYLQREITQPERNLLRTHVQVLLSSDGCTLKDRWYWRAFFKALDTQTPKH